VREVFVRLYEEGLIYRDRYLINWCPRCRTALSDLEVEHADTEGKMYHFALPARRRQRRDRGGDDAPETMLATPRSPSIRTTSAIATLVGWTWPCR